MDMINTLLRDKRKAKGLTMKEVAEAVGVSEATVSRWESGNIANMGRSKIYALSKVLDLSPAEIMGIDIEEIKNNIQEAVNDKNTNWAKAMPIYRTVKLYKNKGYQPFECVGYTRIGDIEDFDNYICLLIPGNEFNPGFVKDDVALIHKQNNFEEKKYFYIVLKDNTHTIRKVIHQNNTLILQSDNSDLGLIFANENEVTIIGKVVALQKNLKLE